jgi:hypothetical protein
VSWDLFAPSEVRYFEGLNIPPELLPAGEAAVDSLWRFASEGGAPRAGCLILATLKIPSAQI